MMGSTNKMESERQVEDSGPFSVAGAAIDADLLQRIARRDEVAYSKFFERYKRIAYHLAFNITRSPSGAEEAVQEGMLRIWRFAGNFKEDGNPRGWILQTISREALKWLRSKRKHGVEVELDVNRDIPTEGSKDRQRSERAEMLKGLRDGMERLPADHRSLLMLYFVAGHSQQEIGRLLSVSQRTVSNKIEFALKALKGNLTKAGLAGAVAYLTPERFGLAFDDAVLQAPDMSAPITSEMGVGTDGLGIGSIAKWTLGVSLLAGAGWVAGPYALNQMTEPQALAPVTPPSPSAVPEVANKILYTWNFSRELDPRLESLCGIWRYGPGSSGRNILKAPRDFPGGLLTLPIERSHGLRLITVRARTPQMGTQSSVFLGWAGVEGLLPYRVSWKPYRLEKGEEYTYESYICGDRLALKLNGELKGIKYFETPVEAAKLVLFATNTNLKEIQIREATFAELPDVLKTDAARDQWEAQAGKPVAGAKAVPFKNLMCIGCILSEFDPDLKMKEDALWDPFKNVKPLGGKTARSKVYTFEEGFPLALRAKGSYPKTEKVTIEDREITTLVPPTGKDALIRIPLDALHGRPVEIEVRGSIYREGVIADPRNPFFRIKWQDDEGSVNVRHWVVPPEKRSVVVPPQGFFTARFMVLGRFLLNMPTPWNASMSESRTAYPGNHILLTIRNMAVERITLRELKATECPEELRDLRQYIKNNKLEVLSPPGPRPDAMNVDLPDEF